MSRNRLVTDVGIAAVLAILVLVIAPGLAVVGLVALLVLAVCGISFAFDLRRHKPPRVAEARRPRRPRPPRSRR